MLLMQLMLSVVESARGKGEDDSFAAKIAGRSNHFVTYTEISGNSSGQYRVDMRMPTDAKLCMVWSYHVELSATAIFAVLWEMTCSPIKACHHTNRGLLGRSDTPNLSEDGGCCIALLVQIFWIDYV